MIKKIPLRNKPLSLWYRDDQIYIGDAYGEIIVAELPYKGFKHVTTANAPVSAIVFIDDVMIYGSWDGNVCTFIGGETKIIKLGRDPVKCISVFDSKIFVSVDTKLIVLDKDLNILDEVITEYKIGCMHVIDDSVIFGLMTGMISRYNNGYIPAVRSKHETNIMSIYKSLTGSSDCTLRDEKEILYTGSGWIRSIFDENLFSSGKDVIYRNKLLYSHDDDVIKVVMIGSTILSIGLDYCCKLYNENGFFSKEEEDEVLEFLNQ